jgi:stage V sporulation protein D (sporulation-specific penicillin-binding protein)
MKKRLFRAHQIFCLLFVFLFLRTAYVQIVQGNWLQRQAFEQQTRDREIASARGSILDRNGRPLAVSVSSEVISVAPSEVRDSARRRDITVEFIAENLAEILSMDAEIVLERLMRESAYVIIKRRVDRLEANAVREFVSRHNIRGINQDADSRRFYPNNNLASHVIGFVGTDNQGLEGIENIMDQELRGTMGRIVSAKNARGLDMPFEYERMVEPEDGLSVVLTLDEMIQQITERHLEAAYIENRLAVGASAIVMEVRTGEILAMATMPNFDLNQPFVLTDERVLQQIEELEDEEERSERRTVELRRLWRNKAVVDAYEPGSTFKILTAAMGLEENVASLDDHYFCSGSMRVADHDIRCWRAGGHGSVNFTEGVAGSCNPMFMIMRNFTIILGGLGLDRGRGLSFRVRRLVFFTRGKILRKLTW